MMVVLAVEAVVRKGEGVGEGGSSRRRERVSSVPLTNPFTSHPAAAFDPTVAKRPKIFLTKFPSSTVLFPPNFLTMVEEISFITEKSPKSGLNRI